MHLDTSKVLSTIALILGGAIINVFGQTCIPDQCAQGYVWREAFTGDQVCVSGAKRQQAIDDNAQAASRRVPGSDSCVQGYVWREASPSDHVCVTGAVRSATEADNAAAPSRLDPECVNAERTNLEPDTDRFGGDYAALPVANVRECRAQCDADVRCKSFTFRKASPWCWLKDSERLPTDDMQYSSGVKGGRPDITVVSLNMAGHLTHHGTWEQRVDRLAAQIAANNPANRPDIISMTETEGWRWCSPGTGVTAGDYDFLDRLVIALAAQTSITYRIAYMVGNEGWYGPAARCRYFSGDALLYNPSRLVNRTPEDVARSVVVGHQSTMHGFQLRRSLPVCNRGAARQAVEGLIDGAPQTDKCNRPTPSGPTWVQLFGELPGETDSNKLWIPISAGRFSFRHDLRGAFYVFTSHLKQYKEALTKSSTETFIQGLTSPPYRQLPHYVPPFLMGDLNAFADDPNSVPGFNTDYRPPRDVMVIRRGDNSSFPSMHDYVLAQTGELGGTQGNEISDHIGIWARFVWVDPGQESK